MKTYFLLSFALLVSQVACQQYQFTCDPDSDCKINSARENGTVPPQMVPDPTNCRKFYTCDSETFNKSSMSFSCGDESTFDGEVEDPGCFDGDCTTPICSNRTKDPLNCYTTCLQVKNNGVIAAPGECGSFFACTEHGMFPVSCTGKQVFNGSACVDDETKACCTSLCDVHPSCVGETDLLMIPDNYGCKTFYLCLNQIALLQTCLQEQEFDIETSECRDVATCGAFCYDPILE